VSGISRSAGRTTALIMFLLSCSFCEDDEILKIKRSQKVLDIQKLWNFSKPQESHDAFLKAAKNYETSNQKHWELLTQAARALGLQSKFDEARELLKKVNGGMNSDEMPKANIRYYLELGRVYNSEGKDKKKARELFLKAYELSKEAGHDYLLVDSAHMLAIVGETREQIEWSKVAIDHAKASEDKSTRGWLGSLYNNLAWTLFEEGRHEEALDMFEGSRKAFEELKKTGAERIARWSIARVHRDMKDYSKAMKMQNTLEKEVSADGTQDGFVFEELALLHEIEGNQEESREHFKKALPLVEAIGWFEKYEPERMKKIREGAQ